MNSERLFELALGLTPPWCIERLEFSQNASGQKQLDLYLSFPKGAKFKDEAGVECAVYDTLERTWQHLNFFQYPCFLHARVPRITTSTGQVKQVPVPWAREGSGFTLLFEAFAMCLMENEMPVNKAAKTLGVYPNRLWTIFNYWIAIAVQQDDQTQVTSLGIDETANKKGHDYVTLAADLQERRVLFATPGKDETTIDRLREHLHRKGVPPEQITHVSLDMSPAFIAGVTHNFANAQIVFDRFHIVKLLNEAMDEVRKAERREHQALKGHKYTFLKNADKLSAKQQAALAELITLYPTLGKAYRFKELFHDFWEFTDKEQGLAFLSWWCAEVEASGIPAFKKFVKTLKSHWSGIINYLEAKIANGILEGINGKIQLAKRRARGYRNLENFINMIYFIAGKLKFNYPHFST
ncbi:MAG: ISL3 family transposase [candidate division KSB1 bacterium]|nr:ISL3 family transposase [candidate division KSB1 bacterium]